VAYLADISCWHLFDPRGRRPVARRRLAALLACPVAVSLLAAATARHARAEADEWRLSGRAGIGSVYTDGRDPFGLRGAVDGEYGLTDAWAVRLSASLSRHDVTENPTAGLPGGTITTYGVFAGLTYAVDVLRLVPYFEAGLGMLSVSGAVLEPRRALGMQVAAGADYLLGPRWSVGGVAEYTYAPFDLVANVLTGAGVPQTFALSVRVSWALR
jgi:hypothetical protein